MNVELIPAPRVRRRKGTASAAAIGVAAIYVRVSTEEQADDGGSLESQEARCRALCEARGLTVYRVYVESHTGGDLDRPVLRELRDDVAAGRVAAVVVYAVDRLTRVQSHLHSLLTEFDGYGAGLAAASQDFDTTTPTGRAMLGMLGIFAELQRDEIRARTKAALKAKAARGEAVGRTPFGLRRDGAGFARHEGEWPIVSRILTERAAGATTAAIADRLNAEGVPTATALRGERRGKVTGPGRWHAASVANLCRNPRVLTAAA